MGDGDIEGKLEERGALVSLGFADLEIENDLE